MSVCGLTRIGLSPGTFDESLFFQGKCRMAYSCFLSYRLISALHAVSGIRAMVDAALHLETQLTDSSAAFLLSSFGKCPATWRLSWSHLDGEFGLGPSHRSSCCTHSIPLSLSYYNVYKVLVS